MADASARRIVFTGASGGIGTMIRPLLAPLYPGLVLSDKVAPKNLLPSERFGGQLRVDVFDLFNHPNFGPPGNIVGTPTFGKITRTRLPTGEAGSSRQIQLAARLSF